MKSKNVAERDAGLINLVFNQMTVEEINKCLGEVVKVFYTDGLTKRG